MMAGNLTWGVHEEDGDPSTGLSRASRSLPRRIALAFYITLVGKCQSSTDWSFLNTPEDQERNLPDEGHSVAA
jgi:hypothetical protein